MMIMKRKSKFFLTTAGISGVTLALALLTGASSSQAATGVVNDFNTAAQLTTKFNSYISAGTVGWGSTGGISGTGAIHAADGDSFAVFAAKSSYSLGPVGSSYAFSAYLDSEGGAGYSGVGFTSLVPSASTDNASLGSGVFRPTDALGVSVHGGGFIFHNGTTDYSGSWGGSSAPIITDTAFAGGGGLHQRWLVQD